MPAVRDDFENMVVETHRDFRVASRIYTDPAIFDEEMHRIFEKTWVYVGHISEVERIGDYKTTTVGKNPVIVSHARDGKIYVMLNACRHRGNAVCRTARGNARSFMCPYHGWAYANNGDLLGVTNPEGYAPEIIPNLGGLLKLRSAVYRGLIFASMDPDVPSIEEHLGDVRKYVDWWADLSPEPEFGAAPPHHYAYDGNWKFQVENSNDGWHARFTHESAFQTFADFGDNQFTNRTTVGRTRGFHRGFGILERQGILQGLSDEQQAAYKDLLLRRHPPAKVENIWNTRYIMIFPNVALFDNLIRVIQPVSATRTNVTSHQLWLRGAPEEWNRVRLREGQCRLSTAGMVSNDDLEMFSSNQFGLNASKLDTVILAHGLGQEQRVEGSEVTGEDHSEIPQRAVYREWARLMTARSH
jgi:phenylpropionate dioxygenase-like ring-hydroxylating dioxygenase large terminal subunit